MRRILCVLALCAAPLWAQGGTIGGPSSTTTFPLSGSNGTVGAPTYSFTNSLTTGIYRFGADTIGIAIAGANAFQIPALGKIVGGAGNMTVVAGTGNSRTITLQATDAGGTARTSLVSVDSQTQTPHGRLGKPAYSFINFATSGMYVTAGPTLTFASGGVSAIAITSTQVQPQLAIMGGMFGTAAAPAFGFTSAGGQIGLYRYAVDTLGIATLGVQSIGLRGGASPTLFGGAGNMTIQAGTGNSRQFAAQTTTSGGTATTFLRANELQQSLFASGAAATPGIGFAADTIMGLSQVGTAGASDSIRVSVNGIAQMKVGAAGVLLLPVLPSESSTKNAMCWDGTTFNVTQNAAATCTVSSARFKMNIVPFATSEAQRIVNRLHSSSYEERNGGRKAIGIIAEQADSADRRLASRDAKGQITSTNYEEVTALLLTVVRDQQRQLDSLKVALRRDRP